MVEKHLFDVQVWFASKLTCYSRDFSRMHEGIMDDLNVVDFFCPD